TWSIVRVLEQFLSREGDLGVLLEAFYELYCDGFYFLKTLGFEYGFTSVHRYEPDQWNSITEQEKADRLNPLLTAAMNEAQSILSGLNDGTLQIVDDRESFNGFDVMDDRTTAYADEIER
ncbi:MAG: hypothetical protein AAFN12_16360, partial [Cyanobacteria bacterium J06560_2]